MYTVKFYIEHVSTQLNDQRSKRAFTRWGRALLLDYLNLGLTEIGTYRPDAFTKKITLTLVPGTVQSAPEGTSLVSIESNLDGSFVNKADASLLRGFASYDICPAKPAIVHGRPVFNIRSYAVGNDNPNEFYVEPAVPKGLNVEVVAKIMGSTPQYTLADWDKPVIMEDKYANNLITFMEAKGFALDMESQSSRAESQVRFRNFYQSMGVKYTMESKFRSGNFNGATGTGSKDSDG